MNLYATIEYYFENGYDSIDEENVEKYLKKASRNIDILTFNRIDIDKVTEWEKEILAIATCEFANFLFENEDILNSTISSYSLNGVSISYDKIANTQTINNVTVPNSVMNLLNQTKYTCRSFYY
jgi:hypothetical protein